MLAYFALEYVFVLLDVLFTPWARVVIEEWTRPFFTVRLQVTWMKEEFAVTALLCDNFWY